MKTNISGLRDDVLDLRNRFKRPETKVKKVSGANKTLATIFYAGKGKRMKGKGFMAMLIEGKGVRHGG